MLKVHIGLSQMNSKMNDSSDDAKDIGMVCHCHCPVTKIDLHMQLRMHAPASDRNLTQGAQRAHDASCGFAGTHVMIH